MGWTPLGTESSFNRAKSEERLARTTHVLRTEIRTTGRAGLEPNVYTPESIDGPPIGEDVSWSSTTTPLPTPLGVTINTSALGIAPSTVGSSSRLRLRRIEHLRRRERERLQFSLGFYRNGGLSF